MATPVTMKLKRKYRERKVAEKHTIRTRTGPMCCNAGCPSTRKKLANAQKRKRA